MYNSGAVNWSGWLLKIQPQSSNEAESAVASKASKDARFHRLLLEDIKAPVQGPTPLLADNKALFDMVNKPGASARTRYFERATRFVQFAQQMLFVLLYLIPTKYMVADIFTKPLDKDTFIKFRSYMLNCDRNPDAGYSTRAKRTLSKLQAFLSSCYND